MENFRRRKLFFERKGVDCSWKSAWERRKTEYFEIYKLLGSKNFHEACRLISDQWKSFLGMLKAAREGRLEPWQKPKPPGYRKRDGQRVPIIVVRFDNYRVDLKKKALHLGYWNVDIPFKGKPRWLTKQGAKRGRLIITYDPVKKRWHARDGVEVRLERKLDNSGLKAGIDLGRERLIAFVTEPLNESGEGVALLYRGGPLKSDYFYFEKRIAEIDRMLADPKLEEADRAVLKEMRRRLYEKRSNHRDQLFANAAHLVKMCEELGVAVLLLGYPRGIAQDKPGKGNTNVWSYRKLEQRIAVTAENHGIPAFEIPEDNTSKTCARHGCEVVRGPGGWSSASSTTRCTLTLTPP
jgi:putative transposase